MAEPAAPEKPAPKPPAAAPAAKSSTLKKALIGAGVGLFTLLAAYGVGRMQGTQTAKQAEKRAEEAAAERQQTKETLAGEQARVERLEARRRIHLALLALDDRNFGIAQEHVSAAAKLLEKSAPQADSELAKLATELSTEKLVATEDVGVQRRKLIGWARRLDEAMPPLKP